MKLGVPTPVLQEWLLFFLLAENQGLAEGGVGCTEGEKLIWFFQSGCSAILEYLGLLSGIIE